MVLKIRRRQFSFQTIKSGEFFQVAFVRALAIKAQCKITVLPFVISQHFEQDVLAFPAGFQTRHTSQTPKPVRSVVRPGQRFGRIQTERRNDHFRTRNCHAQLTFRKPLVFADTNTVFFARSKMVVIITRIDSSTQNVSALKWQMKIIGTLVSHRNWPRAGR